MTTASTTESVPDAGPAEPSTSRREGSRFGMGLTRARLRILGWFLLLVAGAVIVGLVLQRQALLAQLDADLNATMQQELDELEAIAGGVDPQTGEPFTSVQALFDLAIDRNVPLDSEAVASFLGGEPYRASAGGELLFADDDLVDLIASTPVSRSGRVSTELGEVRYIARPVTIGDEAVPDGVFVSAVFTRPERNEVDDAIRTSAIAALAALLLAAAAGWVVAGRVLRPVREVTDAARRISETDLARRIPVEGDDEVAELAVTFNAMLDRLERAFAGQRQFVDDASHELRTPITIIQGHLDLLSDDPEEQAATLAVVHDELDRMNRIVSDLLLLARAGTPDFLRLDRVDLAALVDDVQARAVALGDHPWQADRPESPVLVTADRERLLQAVLNLVANAARHTPPGTPVTIGARRLDDGRAMVWVRDEGPGVPPQEADRIFQRFARGRDQRSGERVGAGLGLAITSAIAEAHGGTLSLRDDGGPGATFIITVPLEGPPT